MLDISVMSAGVQLNAASVGVILGVCFIAVALILGVNSVVGDCLWNADVSLTLTSFGWTFPMEI